MNSGEVGADAAGDESNSQTGSTDRDARKVNELTPEEQMALYEKELKENDWGHQPC